MSNQHAHHETRPPNPPKFTSSSTETETPAARFRVAHFPVELKSCNISRGKTAANSLTARNFLQRSPERSSPPSSPQRNRCPRPLDRLGAFHALQLVTQSRKEAKTRKGQTRSAARHIVTGGRLTRAICFTLCGPLRFCASASKRDCCKVRRAPRSPERPDSRFNRKCTQDIVPCQGFVFGLAGPQIRPKPCGIRAFERTAQPEDCG